MKTRILAAVALCTGLLVSGCTNTIKYDPSAIEKEVNHDISLDALQQSTDSMVSAMMGNPQVQAATKSKRPVLAVFGLIDLTGENVNVAILNNDIYTELNKTDHFRFADTKLLANAREQQNPDLYMMLDTPIASKPLIQTVKADYMLIGEISKIIRNQPALKQVYYRVSLKLVNPKDEKDFMWQEKREFLKSEKKVVYGI